MAILDVLQIGRSGLVAQQRALRTTGVNVANVNTPGYSRQRTDLAPEPASRGYGVRVTGVEQVVDALLEARVRAQTSAAAGSASRRDLLDAVQSAFPVGSSSIGGALQEFFAAASALSTHPSDLAARTDFLDRAGALAARIRGTASDLATLQRETDARVAGEAGEIAALLEHVATLNREVARATVTGGDANALRDQRRQALGALAEHLAIRTVENDDGTVDVFARSGLNLVLGGEAARVEARAGTATGLDGDALHDVGVVAPDGSLIGFGADPGGTLGASLGVRDGDVTDAAARLDLLATTLRDAVNAVQTNAAGRDLDGLVGGALFSGTGALDLTVVLTDPRGIAAAQSTNPGDNTNALALVAVQSAAQGALSGATLGDFFGTLQTEVGAAARDAEDQATVDATLLEAAAAQRDAVSGVNLEEEFTDLIRFQRGFQAAAQLVTLGDRLLETMLDMVRR
jgi:flagellar hook-associated protein 1 FlgK